jgi:hypothetical protein
VEPAFAPGTKTPEVGGYSSVEVQHLLPALGRLNPGPKRSLTVFQARVHGYDRPEEDLRGGRGGRR